MEYGAARAACGDTRTARHAFSPNTAHCAHSTEDLDVVEDPEQPVTQIHTSRPQPRLRTTASSVCTHLYIYVENKLEYYFNAASLL